MPKPLTALMKPEPTEVTLDEAKERRALAKAAKQELSNIAKWMVEDEDYLISLKKRLLSGRLHPTVEVTLWAYAHGKPKETKRIEKRSRVKIVHVFAGVDPNAKPVEKPIEGEVIREDVPTALLEETTDGE